MGLLGVTVTPKYGGLGLGYFEHLLAMEELSCASGSVALSYGAHSNLCVNQIHRHGTEEQKAKYLPDLISGRKIGSLAMSEPESGSDVISMRLRADKTDRGWKLNGNKFWCVKFNTACTQCLYSGTFYTPRITNGPIASTLVVYAKTAPEMGSKGITTFIVEKGYKGFSTHQKLDKVGMRGSDTCELVFEDCEVPHGWSCALLSCVANVKPVLYRECPRRHQPGCIRPYVWPGPGETSSQRWTTRVAWPCILTIRNPLTTSARLMQAAFDHAVEYVHDRKQFGQPVGTFQLMQGMLERS